MLSTKGSSIVGYNGRAAHEEPVDTPCPSPAPATPDKEVLEGVVETDPFYPGLSHQAGLE